MICHTKATVRTVSVFLALGAASVLPTLAHGAKPIEVVAAFHAALDSQDGEAALALLLEEAVIYEQGSAETVEQYASHHLGSDMAFSAATEREVLDQSQHEKGEVTWVTTRSRTTGSFKEREIDSIGVETIVLQHVKEGWRIAHIHWSSRSKR